jgi:hypothetical protein
MVGSAATNPVRTFKSYRWNRANDAVIYASCFHECSFKQTQNFNNHSPKGISQVYPRRTMPVVVKHGGGEG